MKIEYVDNSVLDDQALMFRNHDISNTSVASVSPALLHRKWNSSKIAAYMIKTVFFQNLEITGAIVKSRPNK